MKWLIVEMKEESKGNRIEYFYFWLTKKTHENENETIYKRKLVNSNMRRYDDNVHQLWKRDTNAIAISSQ